MPQTVEPLRVAPEPHPNRIRWTRAQCEAIRDLGVLAGRCELVDGEILSKKGQSPAHRVALVLLREWLTAVFVGLHVQVQAPIGVAAAGPIYNEPEPDAAVTAQPTAAYTHSHPGPEDLVLVAEVSDSTLRFDRTVKAGLYARAGIREYWILDVAARALYVHRGPGPDGYAEIVRFGVDEEAASLVRPEARVRVADQLPPKA